MRRDEIPSDRFKMWRRWRNKLLALIPAFSPRRGVQQGQAIPRSTWIDERSKIPSMADETSQRIEKLECNVAHLEHQLDELNQVVLEHSKLLDRMKKEVSRASNAMQTLELERIKSNVTKPPHYQ